MQVSYKRDLNHNFLILSKEEAVNTESYQIRMLVANPPRGFLKCMMQTIDNQVFFYYEITAKQTLANMYEHKKMKREDIQLLFGELIKTIEGMQSHLLHAGCLLLNPEYIYVDSEKQRAFFCFFPVQETEVTVLFRELSEYLLPKIDHTDQEAVILGYSIYRRAMEETVYLDQIKEELYQEVVTPVSEAREQLWEEDLFLETTATEEALLQTFLQEEKAAVHPAVSTIIITISGILLFGYFYFINNSVFSWHVYVGAAVALLSIAGISAAVYLVKMRKRAKIKNTSETIRQGEEKKSRNEHEKEPETKLEKEVEHQSSTNLDQIHEGETMVLVDSDTKVMPCLVGVHPQILQPIMIKGEVLVLGKLEQAVDVVLPSPAVSRLHAKIVKENGYYLYDLNSRNGTFINHHLLANNEKHELQDGDEVTFGDLTYCFKRAL